MPSVSFTTSGALGKSAIRQANERLLLDSIRRRPGISRAEIARQTGFSRTSVTFVVNRLIGKGLVQEQKSEGPSQTGRPPSELRLVSTAMMAVGVEISPPESRVVLVNLNGETLEFRSIPWKANSDVLLDEIKDAIRSLAGGRRSRRIIGVGVSLPGSVDKSAGRVIAAESIGWFGIEAGKRLSRGLPWRFWYDNNANLCALAEQWFGNPEANDFRYFVCIRAQGGLGTGVVMDGRILRGMSSAAAEFGHVMLYPDGRLCNCGNRGCWEQYASDAALVRAYRERTGGSAVAGTVNVTNEAIRIVDAALDGDSRSLEALRETARYLALGCVNLIAALNPQAIIFGEPFTRGWKLIEEDIRAELRSRVPPYQLSGLRLIPSRLGPDASMLGAAALVLNSFFTRFDHGREPSHPRKSSGVLMEAYR
ncbi:MAG: ROK family transcriptional regulator [Acidobacteria bacterium]|nr:ROK family transcriptional regulator [Acidobacteriota bacterium]